MITLLQRQPVSLTKRPAGTNQRPTLVTPGKTDFQKLFQPAIAGTSGSPAKTNGTSSTTASQAAADGEPAASTPIPIPPITDPHDHSQVEAHMNAWFENVTMKANDQKMQIYQQAMTDWKTNSQHCQDLGLPAPQQPTPPTLDPVQPMPSGWWFLT